VPRPRKHTDEQLIDAAARVIGARGPHQLTLADIGREVGIAPATLLQRFGSKRGLLLAVAASAPGMISGVFAEARARSRTPLGALEAALVALAATISDPDEVANHLAFLALDLGDAEFRQYAVQDSETFRAEIGALLKQAAADGQLELRNRRPLAELLQAAYHGALLMWAIERTGSPSESVRRHVRQALAPHRAAAPRRGAGNGR
jgi:AcrR family transcriptional regulator